MDPVQAARERVYVARRRYGESARAFVVRSLKAGRAGGYSGVTFAEGEVGPQTVDRLIGQMGLKLVRVREQ